MRNSKERAQYGVGYSINNKAHPSDYLGKTHENVKLMYDLRLRVLRVASTVLVALFTLACILGVMYWCL